MIVLGVSFSLLPGDWLALAGLLSGWAGVILGTVWKFNTRLVVVEERLKGHGRRLGALEDSRGRHGHAVMETP
jgi:hypothetical protein